MKLTVREAASLLSVSESEIYRWIEDGDIPCHVVNHQPLFARAELLEWAMARHLPLSPALFDEGARAVHLADAIAAGGVHDGVAGADRDTMLEAVVACLPIEDDGDRDLVLSILRAREAQLSTAVGRGIAIPHVRAPLVFAGAPAVIVTCYLASPVPLGAADGVPVHTVFAMLTPTIRVHLQLLSRLSYALHDASFRAAIDRRAGRAELVELARTVDAAIVDAKRAAPTPDDDSEDIGE